MTKNLLSVLIFCVCCTRLAAQAPFTTMDSININNINAAVLVHGDMWWDPATELAKCYFPNGSKKTISFASAIWMSAYDGAGKLHVAAQTYRQTGNDYWPGPLDSSDTLTYAASQSWAKIWKINRSDIQAFLILPLHTISNTPASILTWPGAGNVYAQGNGGVPLTLYPGNTYAPFVDLNGNGTYEPLLGEYPDVPGDQALWWIFSDNGPAHTESNGRPLDVEVHATAYAYSRGTLMDNVVYYQYDIVNKSPNTYTNFRLAQWADVDLGYYYDDFIGFDSSHRMGITYNGTECDGCAAGRPADSYGFHVPVMGITIVSQPGDSPPSYVPAGAFTYYNNDDSYLGDPVTDSQFNYYMHGQTITGQRFSDDFIGPSGYVTDSFTNYVFTGDPGNHTSWSECTGNNNPGDRRFILSSNDFTVLPNSTNTVVLAMVTTALDSPNGCPNVSFDSIKIYADTAWATYHNPLPPLPAGINNLSAENDITIYPDPAHDKLYVKNTGSQYGAPLITVYNTLGQLMNVSVELSSSNSTVDVGHLPPGLYYLFYNNGSEMKNVKFIKE